MKIGPFRIGYRTIKTSLAVMICILIFQLTNRGTAMVACLAAVFAMRQDMPSTLSFGISRVVGNAIGGVCAILYFCINRYFNHNSLVQLLLIPLLIIIAIVVLDALNNNTGIVGASSTLLFIALSNPEVQSTAYALNRVLDTFIGTFVAISINALIMPQQQSETEADVLAKTCAEKELEIEALRIEVAELKQNKKKDNM